MIITIGWWALPLIASAILWGWAFYSHADDGRTYNLMPIVRVVCAIIGTLASWLAYFIALNVLR